MIHVNHDDAMTYCAWLSEATGARHCLPSEAQGEYACRAGTTTPEQVNYGGDDVYVRAAQGPHRGKTVEVGGLPSNRRGLHEMDGNVYEWVVGWLGAYPTGHATDPQGPDDESCVVRGET